MRAKVSGRPVKTSWSIKEWFFIYLTVLSELSKISRLPPSATKSAVGGGSSSKREVDDNFVKQLHESKGAEDAE